MISPRILLGLLLLAVLVSPAAADTWAGGFPRNYSQIISEAPVSEKYMGTPVVVSHNDIDLRGSVWGDEQMVIFYIDFQPVAPSEYTEFDLIMMDDTIITGNYSFTYNYLLFLVVSHTVTINLGDQTKTFTTPVYQGAEISLYPAKNDNDGSIVGLVMFAKGFQGIASENDNFVFYPFDVRNAPMVAIDVGDAEDDAASYGGPVGAYWEGEAFQDFWGNMGAIKDKILGILGDIYFFFEGAIYWFYFIFIENFMLVLVVYETVGLAYAAHGSKNIIEFGKKAWKVQKGFVGIFMFFFDLITGIVIKAKEIIFRWV